MYKSILAGSVILGSYFIYKSYKLKKILDELEEIFMEEVE